VIVLLTYDVDNDCVIYILAFCRPIKREANTASAILASTDTFYDNDIIIPFLIGYGGRLPTDMLKYFV